MLSATTALHWATPKAQFTSILSTCLMNHREAATWQMTTCNNSSNSAKNCSKTMAAGSGRCFVNEIRDVYVMWLKSSRIFSVIEKKELAKR